MPVKKKYLINIQGDSAHDRFPAWRKIDNISWI